MTNVTNVHVERWIFYLDGDTPPIGANYNPHWTLQRLIETKLYGSAIFRSRGNMSVTLYEIAGNGRLTSNVILGSEVFIVSLHLDAGGDVQWGEKLSQIKAGMREALRCNRIIADDDFWRIVDPSRFQAVS